MASVAKFLATCGTFCEGTRAQDSNWFEQMACSPSEEDCERTFPTPAERPLQAPVTCPKGSCPNKEWLQNPSDCMECTACSLIQETFLRPLTSGADSLLYKHCGEHEFSVMESYGLVSEGVPVVLPFVRFLKSGQRDALASIFDQHGVNSTCRMQRGAGDDSLRLRHGHHLKHGVYGMDDHHKYGLYGADDDHDQQQRHRHKYDLPDGGQWLQSHGIISVTASNGF